MPTTPAGPTLEECPCKLCMFRSKYKDGNRAPLNDWAEAVNLPDLQARLHADLEEPKV